MTAALKLANIDVMNVVESGYDVVIVCTNNEKQCDYWQQRLESVKGSVISPSANVIAVFEDWPGGAGNGLGTLYAYQKACIYADSKLNIDLSALLKAGTHSAALYHTAGKGTRLAPLPGAENNNKPGVKLPVCTTVGGVSTPLTILEGVIKQTGAYAKSRKGRLSVYWGDQIFVPSVTMEYEPKGHIDILCTLGPMPSEAEWSAKGMDGYGLIAVNAEGRAAQVEKVTHAQAVQMTKGLGDITAVGVSLGSFSVSQACTHALTHARTHVRSRHCS